MCLLIRILQDRRYAFGLEHHPLMNTNLPIRMRHTMHAIEDFMYYAK
jgi:hypothetical protein